MQEILGLGECDEGCGGHDLSSLRITAGSMILASRSLWDMVVFGADIQAIPISRHMVTNDCMFMYIMYLTNPRLL